MESFEAAHRNCTNRLEPQQPPTPRVDPEAPTGGALVTESIRGEETHKTFTTVA